MSSRLFHWTDKDFQRELDLTGRELVRFLHVNGVSPAPIFYTTERVCLVYLAGYYELGAAIMENPNELFPTLDIFKKGFENMTSRGMNPDVATVLLSDPSIAVVEGFPESAGKVAKFSAREIMDGYTQLISQGQSELNAAYGVKKFSTGTPNPIDYIEGILSNTPRTAGFTLRNLL